MKMMLKVIGCFVLIVSSVLSQSNSTFPPNFKFGVATAAFQVEGAWNEDGKTESIWDHICHATPTYIDDLASGDVACDSYHKYKEDVQLIKQLGVDFYRFSLSWNRILPLGLAGTPVNEAGSAYYKNLIDELIDNGIEPFVTIHHWDLPQVLQDIGGWPNPELVDHFAYFARTAFDLYGDVVKNWLTFNEPRQICFQGYGAGSKAPGFNSSGIADYKCTHIVLKAHAKAYHIYDEEFRPTQKGRIGMVIDSNWTEPASDSPEDIEAAERAQQFIHGWYGNPVYNGDYPEVMKERIAFRSKGEGYSESRLPQFTQEEIDYINGTYDFVAVNHYTSTFASAVDEAPFTLANWETDLNVRLFQDQEWEPTIADWLRVVPWGIRKLLVWLKETYNNPEILITENGYPDAGGVDDDRRLNYYQSYLENVLAAIIEDEVNVTHYTAWSLLDNMEWSHGYTQKYGLYSVNFSDPNRPRTPKASARYYAQVAQTHCLRDSCL